MTASISDLAEKMGKLDATHQSSEAAIADWIMNSLGGYRRNSIHRPQDKDFLIDAIQAYAKLLQDEGVTVTTD
jgi:hypothetical protein